MRSTLESFEMALKFFLSMGFRIETPLGSFGLKAKGRVETEEEAFGLIWLPAVMSWP
jgi:hypothetical protein